jgi:hypothetical protein
MNPVATVAAAATMTIPRTTASERLAAAARCHARPRDVAEPIMGGAARARRLRLAGRQPAGGDTRGDALLVFRRAPRLELVRRLYLAGAPYAIALDRRRRLLYVTLPGRNELVQLPAHGRPHVLRRWPTVRQPAAVAVEEASGAVTVTGESAAVRVRP